jgi:hypothetical protein
MVRGNFSKLDKSVHTYDKNCHIYLVLVNIILVPIFAEVQPHGVL